MLIPSIVSVVLITLFICYVRIRKRYIFSEKASWNIVDSSYEEWPKRPESLPSKKNKDDIYLDRLSTIKDTIVDQNNNIYSFTKIAGESINSFPLYTTEHSNEEHYLTTIHISFHIENKQIFMDILSLDKDFQLKNNNQFSLLFTNGTQWDFAFTRDSHDEHAASIPLTEQQLQFLAKNRLDKWRLRRDKDDYFTIGAFNFEIKKYVYKPEIQLIIQTMAEKLLPFTTSI